MTAASPFSLEDLPLRAALRGKVPYGAPQDTVPVRLNVNENTHPIPASVIDDITDRVRDALTTVNRYPDRDFDALRADLADYLGHGVTAEQIWAANGSNETMQHLLQAFGGPGRTFLGFAPSYSMYPLLADGSDTEWVAVPRSDDFTLSVEAVVAALREHQPTVAVICTPNNPTGTVTTLEVIEAAYEAFQGVLVVDEAYKEFDRGTPSALTLLNDCPRLVVSRTMSKAFAFAGVRLGYLAAHPTLVDALKLVRLPYHLSALTQAAARGALAHASTMLSTVDEICAQRDRLAAALPEMGLRSFPSGANFLLVEGFADPHAVFSDLRDRGILVRNVGIPSTLRITAGTAEETDTVIRALRDLRA